MTSNAPRFITPPTEDQERFPYRPVWRSLFIETAILTVITLVAFIFGARLTSIVGRFAPYIGIGLAVLPLLLWLLFSWFPERQISQPRKSLITVVFITILVANSIALPLIKQLFRVDQWLPLAPALDRILGYTITVGITEEFIKYLIIRYTVWPTYFRIRLDGIAYGIASGIGYATLINLQFILSNSASPIDVVVFRVIANYALHVSTGIIIGYGLSEVYFSNPTPIFQALVLIVAAIVTGIAIPIHAGLVNASLSITSISAPRPLFGLGFSLGMLIAVSILTSGLIRNADRLEREAKSGDEE